jgi:hypothetical protein
MRWRLPNSKHAHIRIWVLQYLFWSFCSERNVFWCLYAACVIALLLGTRCPRKTGSCSQAVHELWCSCTFALLFPCKLSPTRGGGHHFVFLVSISATVSLIFNCGDIYNKHIRPVCWDFFFESPVLCFLLTGVPKVSCISTESCTVNCKIWQNFIYITIFNWCADYYCNDFVYYVFVFVLYFLIPDVPCSVELDLCVKNSRISMCSYDITVYRADHVCLPSCLPVYLIKWFNSSTAEHIWKKFSTDVMQLGSTLKSYFIISYIK